MLNTITIQYLFSIKEYNCPVNIKSNTIQHTLRLQYLTRKLMVQPLRQAHMLFLSFLLMKAKVKGAYIAIGFSPKTI
jgi:hypothetical protein